MKKLFAFIILSCGLPFFSSAQIIPPYYNDFEIDTIGWSVDMNLPNTWQWTTNGLAPCMGLKGWQIGVNSGNLSTPDAILYSPVFDFTTLTNGTISLKQHFETEPFQEGIRIDYSVNGSPWTVLGSSLQGTNWYNTFSVTSSGLPGWTGNSALCVNSSLSLIGLSGLNNVQFRIFYNGVSVVNPNVCTIDDFCICDSPCVCINSTGINETDFTNQSFYINYVPGKDEIEIVNLYSPDFNALLLDLAGKIIASKQSKGRRLILEIKNISKGIYVLKITGKEKLFNRKLVLGQD